MNQLLLVDHDFVQKCSFWTHHFSFFASSYTNPQNASSKSEPVAGRRRRVTCIYSKRLYSSVYIFCVYIRGKLQILYNWTYQFTVKSYFSVIPVASRILAKNIREVALRGTRECLSFSIYLNVTHFRFTSFWLPIKLLNNDRKLNYKNLNKFDYRSNNADDSLLFYL